MADTYNYSLKGIGAGVEIGEGGPHLSVESGQLVIRSNDGLSLVKILGATGSGPDDFVTVTQLGTKQDTLVSGTNIKTINGQSVLGSGDLTVSASAAGTNTQIQYNNGGVLEASADFTWDNATKTLALTGTDTEIVLNGITNEPTAASAGQLKLYTKSIAGRMYPKWVGPNGLDVTVQPGLGFNRVGVIAPNTGTTLSSLNLNPTTIGTVSHPALASTNFKTQAKRALLTTANAAGNLAGVRSTATEMWRGNVSGYGGFLFLERFAMDTLGTGNRSFHGLYDTAAAPTNIDPTTSTTPGKIGMAINTNTGNWNLVHNVSGTAPTVIALGANFPVDTTTVLEIILFSAPNGTEISYRVRNLITNAETSGTLTTNIPANTSFLGINSWLTNNATTGARAWSLNRMYLESDV